MPDDITDRIDNFMQSMAYHKPTEKVGDAMSETREKISEVGVELIQDIPPCRELSLALTKLEEASMWAIKAMVLHGLNG